MANRQRAEARRKAAAKAARSQEGGSKTLLFVVLGVAAVIAVVVGVIAASGGDDSTATDTTGSSVLTLPDSQPVTVEGDTLATYDPAVTDDPAIGATARSEEHTSELQSH